MKLIHTADTHANRERADVVIASLDEIGRVAETEQADAIIVAGDVWDHATMNVEGSRFSDILQAFKRLADKAPVFMVYGTPTHDAHGSLEVFETIEAKHQIRILRPGQPVIHAGTIFFGVPEPSLRWLVPEAETTQEAQAALRAALSSHMIAIGAQRRAHNGPAVLVYHGQVSGSRLSNGTILEGGTGIMASVDDLKATGCDYIAMGDIHDPQAVGAGVGIVAHYPGSLPPQNFGEEHAAGFNVVKIIQVETQSEGWVTLVDVRRVELPLFPARRTIRLNWVEGRPDVAITPEMISGFMVKLEISCDRTDVPMIDETEMLKRLRQSGAADGSEIAIKARPVETIRFAEIAEKESPEEKLALWFEQSGAPITDEQRLKHRQVAAEVSGEGSGPRPGHIELTRLVLRGATGLKDISGLDEVDWNLDEYPDGLVALIGSNGAGKTTMVENFHPWPQLLTREGTLKSNFFLKDSMRDLYWTDHRDGAKYRAKILINGVTESADPKYFLYWLDSGNWVPIGDVEGRVRGYEEEVNRLFGSLDLFLKSAFVTQSPPNGIAQIDKAKRSERMVLFSALCGLEFWELYKEKAKFHKDAAERRAELQESELAVFAGNLADPAVLAENVTIAEAEVTRITGELQELATQGKAKAEEAAGLKSKAAAQIVVRDQLTASETRIDELRRRVLTANSALQQDEQALRDAPAAEAALRDLESLETAKREQDEAYSQYLDAKQAEQKQVDALRVVYDGQVAAHRVVQDGQRQKQKEARAEYDRVEQKYRDDFEALRRTHETEIGTKRASVTSLLNSVEITKNNIKTLTSEVERFKAIADRPMEDHCVVCRQALVGEALTHAMEAKNQDRVALTRALEKLDEAKTTLTIQEDRAREASEQLASLESKTPKPEPRPGYVETITVSPDLPPFVAPASITPEWNDTTRADLTRKIAAINVPVLRAQVTAAGIARDNRASHETALKNAETDLSVEEKRAEELRTGLDQNVLDLCAAADAEVERLRAEWSMANNQLGGATEKVKAAKAAIVERDAKEAELATRREALEESRREMGVWESLRYAYSDKGVQALELDALAPSISSTANALLEIFGSVFRIEFQTTRISGSGKSAKQVEDLLIQVMNQTTGKSREISLLSGGERVWVLRALYDAFGLIRAKNSDVRFLTAVQDEADGALDVDARMSYLRMIEDAHRRSGRRKTIIVTHSEALQAMIPTKIYVKDLGPRKEGVA